MTPAWLARPLAGLPLRIKLTLAFTGVMAVLLAAAGIALSVLVAAQPRLDDRRRARRARRRRRGGRARRARARRRLDDTGEAFAQVLGRRRARCCDTTPAAGAAPLLDAGAAAPGARPASVIVERAARRAARRCGCSRAPATRGGTG